MTLNGRIIKDLFVGKSLSISIGC